MAVTGPGHDGFLLWVKTKEVRRRPVHSQATHAPQIGATEAGKARKKHLANASCPMWLRIRHAQNRPERNALLLALAKGIPADCSTSPTSD